MDSNIKYISDEAKGRTPVQTFRYFPACTGVVKLKMEKRPKCPKTSGCSFGAQTTDNREKKKNTANLGLGLNFTVNVAFWFCPKDFNKKT